MLYTNLGRGEAWPTNNHGKLFSPRRIPASGCKRERSTRYVFIRSHSLFRLLPVLFTAIALCAGLSSTCLSQPSRFMEEWRWAEFTTESGLPSNHVYAILETQNGTPWAFTKSGIAWYDDYIWHPVPLPDKHLFPKPQSFYSDSRGNIILVCDSTVLVGDTSGFRKIDVSGVVHAVPLPDGRLMLLRVDAGKHHRLEIWNGHELLPAPTPEKFDATALPRLQRTQNGTLWLSAAECLFTWREGRWEKNFCAQPGPFPLLYDALVENESQSGFISINTPYESRGVWEWTNGGKAVRNMTQANEWVRGADISANGTALLAFESGYYRVRYNGLWSLLQLQRPLARQVEMIRFRKNGDLWICTNRGLYLIRYASERWRFISAGAPSSHNYINDILVASDSSLWLATGGGLRVYKKDGTVNTIERILGRTIYVTTGVIEDREGNIWVCSGSSFKGAFIWNGSNWKKAGVGTELEHAQIHRMKLDKKGRIWLLGISSERVPSLAAPGSGAFVYDHGVVTRWSVQEGLPNSRVYAFEEGTDGSLWFGTMAGLSRWNQGIWKHWTLKELFIPERVFALAIDRDGQVWFSDVRGAVGVVGRDESVRRITLEDGLLSEEVWELKCDADGRLWCTTPIGLAVYSNGLWTRFDETSGIPDAHLWPVLPLADKIYVGSNNGLAVLSLEEILHSPSHLYLDQPLTTTNAALLRWKTFAYWGSTPSAHIETRYRIGSHPWSPWNYVHEANLQNLFPGEYVYDVQAKPLFGGDTTTNQTVRSSFDIRLPLSQDPRLVIPVSVVLFILIVLTIAVTTHNRRLKQKQLREELRREHEHAERLAEVDRIKSRFFANISHEFRTPLTLVLGPVGQALSRIKDEWTREKLFMAHRNAEKLHGLINQLLDFSKIESGAMKLAVSKGDIVSFVQRVVQSFQSWAEQKKVQLCFETDEKSIEGYFDRDNVEKILNNLISNALKFTPEGGVVSVSILHQRHPERSERFVRAKSKDVHGPEHVPLYGMAPKALTSTPSRLESIGTALSMTRGGFVAISVRDTGIGIAPEHLPHIFERFYRVDESHRVEGTGIGLALTKELVELHHGSITVQSTPGKGTEFTVTLPLAREHFSDNEIVETDKDERIGEQRIEERTGETANRRIGDISDSRILLYEVVDPLTDSTEVEQAMESEEGELTKRTLILIVEDSADVRAYIREYLVEEYSVLEAQDGAEALEKARQTIPDLVVSDVMMPLMDGYELCRELKQDERTSHIPVILLTARAGIENKIEGLEFGADDYLTKPFDAKELLTRIKNLIEGRRKLREKFSKAVSLKPGEVAIASMEDAFLQKAIAVVEKCMGDEHFSVDQFSFQMNMSRMQLHRKLRALTNQSASEFVRHMRLLRAHELLMKHAATISEIAFQTGFGSLTYFTRCYHEQFGCTPSEARERPPNPS